MNAPERMHAPEKHWTDRVVEELMQSYGVARFKREISVVVDGVDIGVEGYKLGLKKELRHFSAHPECIRWALDNLPQRVTSPAELRDLAKCAPRNQPLAIADNTPANPERAKEVADKVASLNTDDRDHKLWAKRLKERHDGGERLSLIQVQDYREALA